MVESLTPEREVGGSVLEQDTFTSQKVLVIPRKRWVRPDMTEKLLTGTLNLNKSNPKIWTDNEPFYKEVEVYYQICRIFSFHSIDFNLSNYLNIDDFVIKAGFLRLGPICI